MVLNPPSLSPSFAKGGGRIKKEGLALLLGCPVIDLFDIRGGCDRIVGMELTKSILLFGVGILKRFYYWVPALLLDPFDLYERYIYNWLPSDAPERIIIPVWASLLALILLVGWAALRTFHELRLKIIREVSTPTLAKPTTQTIQRQRLEFRVKVEEVSVQQSSYYLPCQSSNLQKTPQCLVIKISFKTNQIIQIASLHLEINSIDPRDIYEPSPHLAQGFQLPHILNQSETHEFQFEVIPAKKPGDYKVILKVLAGGDWYSDGPFSIDL